MTRRKSQPSVWQRLFSRRKKTSSPRNKLQRRLFLENLEPRTVPAANIVDFALVQPTGPTAPVATSDTRFQGTVNGTWTGYVAVEFDVNADYVPDATRIVQTSGQSFLMDPQWYNATFRNFVSTSSGSGSGSGSGYGSGSGSGSGSSSPGFHNDLNTSKLGGSLRARAIEYNATNQVVQTGSWVTSGFELERWNKPALYFENNGNFFAPNGSYVTNVGAQVDLLSTTQGVIGFGHVYSGSVTDYAFNIINYGGAPLTLDNKSLHLPPGFSIVGSVSSVIAPLASQTIHLRFTAPSTAGYYGGTLELITNDSNRYHYPILLEAVVERYDAKIEVLHGGQPITNAASVVTYGVTDRSKTFTIRNGGTAPMSIDVASIVVPTGFQITSSPAASVAPGMSTTFTLGVNAQEAGSYSGNVVIPSNDPDDPLFQFGVTATVAPRIAVLDGQTVVASGSGTVSFPTGALSKTLTIRNDGNMPLAINLAAISVPSWLSVSTLPESSLVPGATTTLVVSLQQFAAGTYSGQLSIPSSDSQTPVFETTIQATTAPTLEVKDGSNVLSSGQGTVDWGTAYVGVTTTRTFTLKNNGNANLEIGNIVAPTGFSIESIERTAVAPGQTCTITVALNTTAAASFSGPLEIATNAGATFVVNMLAAVVVGNPQIVVSRPWIDDVSNHSGIVAFGQTLAGTPVQKVVSIKNNGTGILLLNEASLSLPAGFRSVTALPTRIAAGESASWTIELTAETAGTPSGVVSFSTNDGDDPLFEFHVSGTVIAAAPRISVDAPVVDFGQVWVGDSAEQTITLQNLGNTNLLIDTNQITVSPGFTITKLPTATVTPFSGMWIGPDGTGYTTIKVRFQPTTDGLIEGTLSIPSNDPQQSPLVIQLKGTAAFPGVMAVSTNGDPVANGDTVNVGTARTGDVVAKSITITNPGTHPLTFFAFASGGFQVSDSSRITLQAGESRTLQVLVKRSSAGMHTGELRIRSNDPTKDPFVVHLTMTATPSPNLEIEFLETTRQSGDEIQIGRSLIGASIESRIKLKNVGSEPLAIIPASFGLTGGFELVSGPNAMVAAGESTSVVIRYTPTALGRTTGTLHFATNDLGDPQVQLQLVASATEIIPGIGSLGLFNDTGLSRYDGRTSDPRIQGIVDQVAGWSLPLQVEFDHNGDGVVDGTATFDNEGKFVYDPRLTDPAFAAQRGPVVIRCRTACYDANGLLLAVDPWRSVKFELAPPTDSGAADIDEFRLAVDSGSNKTDRVTINPTVIGSVVGAVNDGILKIEFDHSGNGVASGEVVVNPATRTFFYDPRVSDPSIADARGAWTLLARTVIVGQDGSRILGAWKSLAMTLTAPILASAPFSPQWSTKFVNGRYEGAIVGSVDSGTLQSTNIVSSHRVEFEIDGVAAGSVWTGPMRSATGQTFEGYSKSGADLALGQHTVRVRVWRWNDEYGANIASEWSSPLAFSVLAPQAPSIVSLAQLTTPNADPTKRYAILKGRISEPVAGVRVEIRYDGHESVDAVALTDAQGYFQVAPRGLSQGVDHAVSVRAVILNEDSSLLVAGASVSLNFQYQLATPPNVDELKISNATGNNPVLKSAPTLQGVVKGTGELGNVLIEFDHDANDANGVNGTVQTYWDGTFSYRPAGLAFGASYAIRARSAYWSAGNGVWVYGEWKSVSFQLAAKTFVASTLKTFGLAEDNGAHNDDRITSNPALKGKIENTSHDPAFAKVEFDFVGDGTVSGSAVVNASDEFLYLPAGLPTGVHSVRARIVEWDYNTRAFVTGNWSTPFAFTLVSPTLPAADLNLTFGLQSDTGTSATDLITANPALIGRVAGTGNLTGVMIEFNEHAATTPNQVDGIAFCDAAGTFRYAPRTLQVGNAAIQARWVVWDPTLREFVRGNWSSSFTFELEAATGVASSVAALQFEKSNAGTRFTGRVAGEGSVDRIRVEFRYSDSATATFDEWTWTDRDGNFVLSPQRLSGGTTTVFARTREENEATSAVRVSSWKSFTINNPTAETVDANQVTGLRLSFLLNSVEGVPVTTDPRLEGKIANGKPVPRGIVEFDTNGDGNPDGQVIADTDGSFSFSPRNLPYGQRTISVRVKRFDAEGNAVLGTWHSPITFVLKSVSSQAPRITSLKLLNDTGSSSTDLATYDGRITGTIEGIPADTPYRIEVGDSPAVYGQSVNISGPTFTHGFVVAAWSGSASRVTTIYVRIAKNETLKTEASDWIQFSFALGGDPDSAESQAWAAKAAGLNAAALAAYNARNLALDAAAVEYLNRKAPADAGFEDAVLKADAKRRASESATRLTYDNLVKSADATFVAAVESATANVSTTSPSFHFTPFQWPDAPTAPGFSVGPSDSSQPTPPSPVSDTSSYDWSADTTYQEALRQSEQTLEEDLRNAETAWLDAKNTAEETYREEVRQAEALAPPTPTPLSPAPFDMEEVRRQYDADKEELRSRSLPNDNYRHRAVERRDQALQQAKDKREAIRDAIADEVEEANEQMPARWVKDPYPSGLWSLHIPREPERAWARRWFEADQNYDRTVAKIQKEYSDALATGERRAREQGAEFYRESQTESARIEAAYQSKVAEYNNWLAKASLESLNSNNAAIQQYRLQVTHLKLIAAAKRDDAISLADRDLTIAKATAEIRDSIRTAQAWVDALTPWNTDLNSAKSRMELALAQHELAHAQAMGGARETMIRAVAKAQYDKEKAVHETWRASEDRSARYQADYPFNPVPAFEKIPAYHDAVYQRALSEIAAEKLRIQGSAQVGAVSEKGKARAEEAHKLRMNEFGYSSAMATINSRELITDTYDTWDYEHMTGIDPTIRTFPASAFPQRGVLIPPMFAGYHLSRQGANPRLRLAILWVDAPMERLNSDGRYPSNGYDKADIRSRATMAREISKVNEAAAKAQAVVDNAFKDSRVDAGNQYTDDVETAVVAWERTAAEREWQSRGVAAENKLLLVTDRAIYKKNEDAALTQANETFYKFETTQWATLQAADEASRQAFAVAEATTYRDQITAWSSSYGDTAWTVMQRSKAEANVAYVTALSNASASQQNSFTLAEEAYAQAAYDANVAEAEALRTHQYDASIDTATAEFDLGDAARQSRKTNAEAQLDARVQFGDDVQAARDLYLSQQRQARSTAIPQLFSIFGTAERAIISARETRDLALVDATTQSQRDAIELEFKQAVLAIGKASATNAANIEENVDLAFNDARETYSESMWTAQQTSDDSSREAALAMHDADWQAQYDYRDTVIDALEVQASADLASRTTANIARNDADADYNKNYAVADKNHDQAKTAAGLTRSLAELAALSVYEIAVANANAASLAQSSGSTSAVGSFHVAMANAEATRVSSTWNARLIAETAVTAARIQTADAIRFIEVASLGTDNTRAKAAYATRAQLEQTRVDADLDAEKSERQAINDHSLVVEHLQLWPSFGYQFLSQAIRDQINTDYDNAAQAGYAPIHDSAAASRTAIEERYDSRRAAIAALTIDDISTTSGTPRYIPNLPEINIPFTPGWFGNDPYIVVPQGWFSSTPYMNQALQERRDAEIEILEATVTFTTDLKASLVTYNGAIASHETSVSTNNITAIGDLHTEVLSLQRILDATIESHHVTRATADRLTTVAYASSKATAEADYAIAVTTAENAAASSSSNTNNPTAAEQFEAARRDAYLDWLESAKQNHIARAAATGGVGFDEINSDQRASRFYTFAADDAERIEASANSLALSTYSETTDNAAAGKQRAENLVAANLRIARAQASLAYSQSSSDPSASSVSSASYNDADAAAQRGLAVAERILNSARAIASYQQSVSLATATATKESTKATASAAAEKQRAVDQAATTSALARIESNHDIVDQNLRATALASLEVAAPSLFAGYLTDRATADAGWRENSKLQLWTAIDAGAAAHVANANTMADASLALRSAEIAAERAKATIAAVASRDLALANAAATEKLVTGFASEGPTGLAKALAEFRKSGGMSSSSTQAQRDAKTAYEAALKATVIAYHTELAAAAKNVAVARANAEALASGNALEAKETFELAEAAADRVLTDAVESTQRDYDLVQATARETAYALLAGTPWGQVASDFAAAARAERESVDTTGAGLQTGLSQSVALQQSNWASQYRVRRGELIEATRLHDLALADAQFASSMARVAASQSFNVANRPWADAFDPATLEIFVLAHGSTTKSDVAFAWDPASSTSMLPGYSAQVANQTALTAENATIERLANEFDRLAERFTEETPAGAVHPTPAETGGTGGSSDPNIMAGQAQGGGQSGQTNNDQVAPTAVGDGKNDEIREASKGQSNFEFDGVPGKSTKFRGDLKAFVDGKPITYADVSQYGLFVDGKQILQGTVRWDWDRREYIPIPKLSYRQISEILLQHNLRFASTVEALRYSADVKAKAEDEAQKQWAADFEKNAPRVQSIVASAKGDIVKAFNDWTKPLSKAEKEAISWSSIFDSVNPLRARYLLGNIANEPVNFLQGVFGGFFVDGLRDDVIGLPTFAIEGLSFLFRGLFGASPPVAATEQNGAPNIPQYDPEFDTPQWWDKLFAEQARLGGGFLPKTVHGQKWAWEVVEVSRRLPLISASEIYNVQARVRIAASAIMSEVGDFLTDMSPYDKGRVVGAITYEVMQWTGYGAAVASTGGAVSALAVHRTAAFIARFTNLVPKCNDIKKIGAILQRFSTATGIGSDFANGFAKAADKFGCFIAETPVWTTVRTGLPVTVGDGHEVDSPEWVERPARIETVAVGSRIQSSNPRRDDYDFAFSGRDGRDWYVIRLVARHANGAIVDVELLRPAEWVVLHALVEGQTHSFRLGDIDIVGSATITSIEPADEIDDGPGELVTARFVTRHACDLVRMTFANGETLTGTANHPIWSPERGEWLPMGDFAAGDLVSTRSGNVVIASIEFLAETAPVYNIEVAGEHVYEVTPLGVLVHNNNSWLYDKIGDLQRLEAKGIREGRDVSELQKELRKLRKQVANGGEYRTLQQRLDGLYNRADGADLLDESLTDFGITRPPNSTPHHLIPMSLVREFDAFFKKAVAGGWDMNGARNGKFLDRIAHPIGGSHPRIQGYVRGRLTKWINANGGLSRISGESAKDYLEYLAKQMSDYFDAHPGENINNLFEWID